MMIHPPCNTRNDNKDTNANSNPAQVSSRIMQAIPYHCIRGETNMCNKVLACADEEWKRRNREI